MAELLKGTPVADAITAELTDRAAELRKNGIMPKVCTLRVGNDNSAIAYERNAIKRCSRIGIDTMQLYLPEDCSQTELEEKIDIINDDSSVHGCLMFRPLPGQIDEYSVCERLNPVKDIDCITSTSLNHIFTGFGAGYNPCTAQACIELLKYYGYNLVGKQIVVIGRSMVIGKPVSLMLQSENATVTMCHTKTRDMASLCRNAEILIVAAGKPCFVDETYVNPNQIVIDVGINTDSDGRLCGDVCFDRVEPVVSAISPVPGGVGSVTTSILCKHIIESAEKIEAIL